MLVLTRHSGESITIDETIVISVLAIEGDRVKLGISAPREVKILRTEIYQAVVEQAELQVRLSQEESPPGFDGLRQLLVDAIEQEEESRGG
ncbi:MAG TPA: carbon storage regulator CsrA [Anaerolineaceae bacterium]|nr:carbon storage regulator CsrA [Anaerolineaceae bacterium]